MVESGISSKSGPAFPSWMQIQRKAIYPCNCINIPCRWWYLVHVHQQKYSQIESLLLGTREVFYLATRGAQHRINLGTLKHNEHLCEEERKRKVFACIETTFLYFEKGSFKDTLQWQVWEFFLMAAMSLPSCLAKEELMHFDKLILTAQIIPSQPSHNIQFKPT